MNAQDHAQQITTTASDEATNATSSSINTQNPAQQISTKASDEATNATSTPINTQNPAQQISTAASNEATNATSSPMDAQDPAQQMSTASSDEATNATSSPINTQDPAEQMSTASSDEEANPAFHSDTINKVQDTPSNSNRQKSRIRKGNKINLDDLAENIDFQPSITPPFELQHPDPELLKKLPRVPKWLIQWCVLKSTKCNSCFEKLEAYNRFEAAEEARQSQLQRIEKQNKAIKARNDLMRQKVDLAEAHVDMQQAKVDRIKIENELQRRTPYLLGEGDQSDRDRRTSSWKSIFERPLFRAFEK